MREKNIVRSFFSGKKIVWCKAAIRQYYLLKQQGAILFWSFYVLVCVSVFIYGGDQREKQSCVFDNMKCNTKTFICGMWAPYHTEM